MEWQNQNLSFQVFVLISSTCCTKHIWRRLVPLSAGNTKNCLYWHMESLPQSQQLYTTYELNVYTTNNALYIEYCAPHRRVIIRVHMQEMALSLVSLVDNHMGLMTNGKSTHHKQRYFLRLEQK